MARKRPMIRAVIGLVLSIVCAAALTPPQTVAAQTTRPSQRTYVALGDSVAAELGLPGVSTPRGRDALCGRSARAYASAVARSAKLPLKNYACSGATAGDLVTRQGIGGPNIQSQLTSAFASGTPQLITITAGANDVHWADLIRSCYAVECPSSGVQTAADLSIVAMQAKLHAALASIYVRSSGTPPTVIVTGYYNPVSTACGGLQDRVTATELEWVGNQTDALNSAIRAVTEQYNFVRFAPVDFSGHDICSGTPWVQGIADKAPFHPNAAGQKAIARSVISSLQQ